METLLLFDVGNTTIKVGVRQGTQTSLYNLRSDRNQTADSLGLLLLSLLGHCSLSPKEVQACVASSVVPALDPILKEAVARFLACPLFFTPADLPIPLKNCYLRPEEVGADRLVGAYAARRRYPSDKGLIVVDFGTAVTFDCLVDNEYRGGLIFPGPYTALNALASATAKLPSINLDCDSVQPVPGQDTVTSIRHGILFGFASLVDGLVTKLDAQLGLKTKVIATGGLAPNIARVSTVIDEVAPSLLLEGLWQLYRERQPSK